MEYKRTEYPEEYAEIDGRLYLQAQLLLPQGNYPELSKVISILVFDVQHKLKAMLYHKRNYLNIENYIINKSVEDGKDKAEIPHELNYEFEAFLFQTKSALDITIKLLEPLFPNTFKVGTFTNKGLKLINNLNEYKKKVPKQLSKKITDAERLSLAIKYRSLTIDNIIKLLQDDGSAWLCKAIDTRDTISHFKGSLNLTEYSIEKTGEEINIVLPKILDVYPRYFLENTYNNCIEFIQDFMCLFIELWLPPLFCITQASDSNPTLKTWRDSNVAAAKYIKFMLGGREWV
jgi:hypothetical protein